MDSGSQHSLVGTCPLVGPDSSLGVRWEDELKTEAREWEISPLP